MNYSEVICRVGVHFFHDTSNLSSLSDEIAEEIYIIRTNLRIGSSWHLKGAINFYFERRISDSENLVD